MFVTQQIVPRCKEWLPLATNQLRLRNLIQILAFSIKENGTDSMNTKGLKVPEEVDSKVKSYYYTLHLTAMSAPFYTSEKISDDSPKWKEIEINSFIGNVPNSVDAFVIRLWCSTKEPSQLEEVEDQIISIWGVYLNGLTYLGQNLGYDIPLKSNSIVFLMPGGYFTDMNCLESKPKIRFTSMYVNQSEIQQSYTVSTLTRVHTIQQVIKKELAEVDLLKQKISMGDFIRSETREKTMLRRLLSKNKPRVSHQDYIRVKENIELARYRVHILREEKEILSTRLKELKSRIEMLTDENQLMESRIMENYRVLMRKIQIQRESKRDHICRREAQLHSKAKLSFRAKQLISELNIVYPIVEKSPEKFTICGVHLPNSEDFAGHDEIQISVALGFVTHVVQMISVFLQVPLRYPVIHFGSRSRIIDHISDKIPDSEREFPLYIKGKEKLQFHYAVYLLNKNIAQLRWLCGLPTSDLRNTLSNLSTLVKMKTENCNLDQGNRSLSSSTADVYSSCFSMSSPLGSVLSLSNKKNVKIHRISDSCTDMTTGAVAMPSSRTTPGHRLSKSVGSAQDLMINVFSSKSQNGECSSGAKEGKMSNSLSYSLDKGLNEYEEVSGSSGTTRKLIESDACAKCSSANDVEFSESKQKNRFLSRWETEKQCVPFSDDDSDVNTNESKISADVEEITGRMDDKLIGYDTSNLEIKGEDLTGEGGSNNVEYNEVGLPASESSIIEGKVIMKTHSEQFPCDIEVSSAREMRKCGAEDCLIESDNLLESVTTRTEALANQTTSFNRFRTRFKSTLENSS